MNKINRHNVLEHLLEYQFKLIGQTLQGALGNKKWREEWYTTKENEEKLRKYAIPLMKRVFKCNKSNAESNFNWFLLNYSLKIKE